MLVSTVFDGYYVVFSPKALPLQSFIHSLSGRGFILLQMDVFHVCLTKQQLWQLKLD